MINLARLIADYHSDLLVWIFIIFIAWVSRGTPVTTELTNINRNLVDVYLYKRINYTLNL